MGQTENKRKILIVGAGLVGSIAAVYFAKHGFDVEVYEARPDLRGDTHYEGRSINLALSVRGISSLREIGLSDTVVKEGLPMFARMLHSHSGSLTSVPYGVYGEAIFSVDRKHLNVTLMNEAERVAGVKMFFDHKCLSIDFDEKEITFQKGKDIIVVKGDLIVGTDGAFSSVRKELMRKIRMDYSQVYIPHGYKELTIYPENGDYKMNHKVLHIWPRHTFMMIALPNQDKTFTCTLFMPFENFDSIKTDDDVIQFFRREFPDALELIGVENLKRDYMNNPVGSLVTVKCKPYHYKGNAVILGDASHAMVPFYGQGMNCGFQDVKVLFSLFEKHDFNFESALDEYSRVRNPDAEAICDLAMYNYIEMRSTVTSFAYRVRKTVESLLHRVFPSQIIPLYTMVAFTEIPYSEVMKRWHAQTDLLNRTSVGLALASLSFIGFAAFKLKNHL